MLNVVEFYRKPGFAKLMACLIMLSLSACGRVAQVSSENQSSFVAITNVEKKSLEKIEASAFTDANMTDCVSSRSNFYLDVARLIDKINPVLANMQEISPPVRETVMLDFPPRMENTIGVFLCDGMTDGADTLFRTVSLSNKFLADLKAAAVSAPDGDDALFNSALAFVLYHELGHAALNHSALKLRGDEKGFGLPQEMEADQFALDSMSAVGIDNKGVEIARSVEGR